MAYHSRYNEDRESQQICGCALLPLKTNTNGPAPKITEGVYVLYPCKEFASIQLERSPV